jgi:4-amino-4-deoxy-L-arabinose transferase-like glycosyltransferase
MWKEIKNKEVAILASLLFAVQPLALTYRIFTLADSLFVFLTMLCILLLYKSSQNIRYLYLAAFTAGLSALTRWEGYAVVGTVIFYITWKLQASNKHERSMFISIVIVMLIPAAWLLRNVILTGNMLSVDHLLYFGEPSLGLGWFYAFVDAIAWPLLLLSVIGLLLSFRKYKSYVILYVFFTFYSVIHIIWPVSGSRYVIPLMPILLGWSSLALFNFLNNAGLGKDRVSKTVRYAVYGIIITIFLCASLLYVQEQTVKFNNEYKLERELAKWLNENADKNSTTLVADTAIVGFYTDARLIGYDDYTGYVYKTLRDNPSQKWSILLYIKFLKENNIHYFVPYSSTSTHYYFGTKTLADNFQETNFTIDDQNISLEPIKIFYDDQNRRLYLYRVDQ